MPGRRCRRCQTSRPPGPRDKLSTSDRLPGRSEQKEGASAPQRPVEDRPSLPALQPAGGLWPWSSSCDSNCDSKQCSCSINLALTDKLNNEDEFWKCESIGMQNQRTVAARTTPDCFISE